MADNLRITPVVLLAAASGDFSNALIAGTPGGIERQEAEGQRDMASSFRTLPKDMDRATAEAFGFVFGDDADDIFVNVTAPQGWAIRPTEHSMHSDIVDDKGRVRGSIFYKAAFYDRTAHGRWEPRYRTERDNGPKYEVLAIRAVDGATGETLFSESVPEGGQNDHSIYSEVEGRISTRLAEQFPDYRDATAYWSE